MRISEVLSFLQTASLALGFEAHVEMVKVRAIRSFGEDLQNISLCHLMS